MMTDMRGDEMPRHLRMFVDDVSEILLWSNRGGADLLEDRLPISESLRARLKSWLDEYTRSISSRTTWSLDDEVDHDRRGSALCAELQAELGPDFEIEYHFHTPRPAGNVVEACRSLVTSSVSREAARARR